MKSLAYLLLLFNILVIHSACTKAQPEKPKPSSDFLLEEITAKLYVIKSPNYNTNSGLFIGDTGLVLIDPMTGTNNHNKLLEFIKTFSNKPILHVINTHSHLDHSGANEFFANLGAKVISQENSLYSQALHQITYKDSHTLKIGSETIQFFHTPSHSFDDALIYFKENNAVFMGDLFMTNWYPFFHHGGGSNNHFKALNKALSLGDENTTIIPAHGLLRTNKKHLKAYLQNSEEWVNRILSLHQKGMDVQEMTKDEQLNQIRVKFNISTTNYFSKIIEKVIATDGITPYSIFQQELFALEGIYHYNDQKQDEIIVQTGKLYMRRLGAYIYELIPVSTNKFQLKGQVPYQYVSFTKKGKVNELIYDDGKRKLSAIKTSTK